MAAATNAATITSYTPIWRNIVISNFTATAGQPGMIWARTEMPATNIILNKLNITASPAATKISNLQCEASPGRGFINLIVSAANYTFWLFNADVTIYQ